MKHLKFTKEMQENHNAAREKEKIEYAISVLETLLYPSDVHEKMGKREGVAATISNMRIGRTIEELTKLL